MRSWLLLIVILGVGVQAFAQSFELLNKQESYQAGLSETLKIPIQIKNNSDKAQYFIIRKAYGDVGATQRGYFCFKDNCLEPGMDASKRIGPGETLNELNFVLETGLMTGLSNFQFEVFVREYPLDIKTHTLNIGIDEKGEKRHVFQSREITIHDVYPNPVSDQAYIDYRLHSESVKAKVVIHNILGRAMGEYELPFFENKVKILAEELAAGVYFYTIYLDNDGVLTRKLIVRK
jgi:hypothetical protein